MKPTFIYTRAQAIADGVLTELTEQQRFQSALFLPTVVSSTVMDLAKRVALRGVPLDVLANLTPEAIQLGTLEMLDNLLHACGTEVRLAGQNPKSAEQWRVTVMWEAFEFIAEIGPDDKGEPCWTILTPEDD